MYFEATVASDIYRLEAARNERQAALKWRTRHLKSREAQVLTAALTSVLRLFVR